MSYANWEKRLNNVTVPTHEQPYAEDEGYYRKPIIEKQMNAAGKPNGRNKIVDFIPVAIFLDQADGKTLVVHIGAGDDLREIDTPEAIARADFWTWCCRHPITHQAYNDALAGKPWTDLVKTADPVKVAEAAIQEALAVPAANREVTLADNQPPVDEPAEELPLDQQHANAIDAVIAKASLKIVNDVEAAAALGNKNLLAELRLAADKDGKAIYEPLYRVYTAEQKKWSPIVKRASDYEAKLNTAILTYRETERKRLAKIAADKAAADAKAEEERLAEIARLEEINTRAADRAIINGEEIPEPLVPEEPEPAYAPSPVFEAPTPAPLAPTYGSRKLKEEVKLILDAVTSYDEVYKFLRDDPKVKALLLEIATAKVKAGFTVPGTTTREGLI